jgi:hypothetical protein
LKAPALAAAVIPSPRDGHFPQPTIAEFQLMRENPTFQNLFTTTFDNMCFFFEEALPSFFDENKPQKLDKLG